MGVSITEVAKATGVSRMTVTRVMRGDAVSDATRVRVLEAMASMGYVPSPAARAMRSKDRLVATQSGCFALVFGSDTQNSDEFFCEIARGAEHEAGVHGLCALHIHWLDDLAASWPRMQALLSAGGVCGAILAGQFSKRDVEVFSKALKNVVIVDGPAPADARVASIEAENVGGCELALKHLLARGNKELVVLSGPTDHYFTGAMLQAVGNLKGEFRSVRVVNTNYTAQGGGEALRAVLRDGHAFDAVFGNDALCIGGMRALAESGLRVPDDVAVVGFDNISLSAHLKPSLTTVNIDKRRLGREAVNALVALVRDQHETTGLRTIIRAELVERESA